MEKIKTDLFYVGVNDRTTDLFEGQWPLPEGISYNSYLLLDDENVLVDSVSSKFSEEWLQQIESIVDPGEIDYLVVNHLEPDHSGSIPVLRRINPELTLIGTEKTAQMLEKFYGITSGIDTFEAGEQLNTGSNKFVFTPVPFVHWPESMVTYEANRQVLFSNDVFGTFGVLEGGLFHDETALDHTESEMLRYYSNVVGAYTTPANQALDKLEDIEIELIAPGHGPLWQEELEVPVNLYRRWSKMKGEPGVTVIFGTMYDHTKQMMEAVISGIQATGMENFKIIDAARTHPSFILAETWRRSGVLIGSPTYGTSILPPVNRVVHLLREKTLINRIAGFFGSHGWSGGAIKELEECADKLNWAQPADPVKFSGRPEKDELATGRELGKTVARAVQE